ncbi:hypothetical protein KUL156_02460 [Alteromonas sp. KUL156]|nr:hypothetical protein KUL154_23620 [Alteromonas sp. KUL154]GFD97653.1 hypothetical protein KUL156_02460 [Alteromonas sp. KUL156]
MKTKGLTSLQTAIFCVLPIGIANASLVNIYSVETQNEIQANTKVTSALTLVNDSDIHIIEGSIPISASSEVGAYSHFGEWIGYGPDIVLQPVASANAKAKTKTNTTENGFTATLSGKVDAQRVDAVTQIGRITTKDQNTLVQQINAYEVVSLANARATSELRIETSPSVDGILQLQNAPTDFAVYASFGDNLQVGDSLANRSSFRVSGRDIDIDGYATQSALADPIDITSYSSLMSVQSNLLSPSKQNDGTFSGDSTQFYLEGSFEDFLYIYATSGSQLAYQSENDGGIVTQYKASNDYYVNVIIGEGVSQDNPVMPHTSNDETGVYTFENGASGAWFDPLVFENYLFSIDSVDTYFSDILSFPTGFGDTFGLYAFDNSNAVFDLGAFDFRESISFDSLLNDIDVTSFLVTGIEDDDDTHQFPIQLAFSQATADFTMQGIEDASAFLATFNNVSNVDATVPEPASISLLAFFAALLVRRKIKV